MDPIPRPNPNHNSLTTTLTHPTPPLTLPRARTPPRRYVAQEDSLLGVFTVAESLRFAVRFYHGYASVDTEELEAEALKLVGLEWVGVRVRVE